MKCVTPMIRYYCQPPEGVEVSEDEKMFQKIIPRSEVFDRLGNDEYYLTKIQDKNEELAAQGSNYRYQLIPCKHCWACKLKYSAEWASRLTMEAQYHEHKYFITLTYDEQHLPMYEKMIYTDSEGQKHEYENDGTWTGSLNTKHVTRFINTLRKYYERQGITGIKYFYCGEYGPLGRPHYHLILFGAPLDINQFYDWHLDKKHHKLHWKSKEIEKWWGMGMVDVAEVEWNSCAYVARYCMKKINNDNDPREYAAQGKIPEIIRMSRKPGIGMKYYEDHKEDIYENDEIIQKTIKGNVSAFKPPKAFDKKFEAEYPEVFKMIKESRLQCAERDRLLKKDLMKGISDKEKLLRETENVMLKGNMLRRELEM